MNKCKSGHARRRICYLCVMVLFLDYHPIMANQISMWAGWDDNCSPVWMTVWIPDEVLKQCGVGVDYQHQDVAAHGADVLHKLGM